MALLTEREERQRVALNVLMHALHKSDRVVADRAGMKRSTLQKWRSVGGVKFRAEQIELLADALEVPPEVFDLPADELLRWLADRSDLVVASCRWSVQPFALAS